MTLQEFYAQIGGNYADTVRRLCNESLVLRFVKKYPANPSFDELCAAVDQADWETAFRAVHTLKGVAQNLGFDRLYAVSVPLTEAMRGGAADRSCAAHRCERCASGNRRRHSPARRVIQIWIRQKGRRFFCDGLFYG